MLRAVLVCFKLYCTGKPLNRQIHSCNTQIQLVNELNLCPAVRHRLAPVGLLSGSYASTASGRTCGAQFLSASNIGQAGGMARANVAAGLLLGHSSSDRSLGIKVGTAAATLATGKLIRMVATFAPIGYGMVAAS